MNTQKHTAIQHHVHTVTQGVRWRMNTSVATDKSETKVTVLKIWSLGSDGPIKMWGQRGRRSLGRHGLKDILGVQLLTLLASSELNSFGLCALSPCYITNKSNGTNET